MLIVTVYIFYIFFWIFSEFSWILIDKFYRKQLHPTFDEDFQFEVTGLDKILKISLFAKSDFGQTDAEVGI